VRNTAAMMPPKEMARMAWRMNFTGSPFPDSGC